MAVYGKPGRGAVEKITQMRLNKRDELLGSSIIDRATSAFNSGGKTYGERLGFLGSSIVVACSMGLMYAVSAQVAEPSVHLIVTLLCGIVLIWMLYGIETPLGRAIQRYPDRAEELYNAARHSRSEIKRSVRHGVSGVLNAGSQGRAHLAVDKYFDKEERSWIIGAYGEIMTARLLDELSMIDCDIIHDIELLGDDGEVKANIDHVVVTPDGYCVIDTKVWSDKVVISSDTDGRSFIAAGDAHSTAISTVLYEASFLPSVPRAIIFAVGGHAGKELATSDDGFFVVDHYVDKFSGELQPASVDIYFVPQQECAQYVQRIFSQYSSKKAPWRGRVSTKKLLKAKNIRLAI